MAKRVLILTPYPYGTAPGPRSSIELWEHVLEPAGVTFEYAPFGGDRLHEVLYLRGHTFAKARGMVGAYAQRMRLMRRLREFDAVLVYREAALIGPAFFERWVARSGVPIIYQLDDPLYIPYRSPSNGYLSYLKFFGKVGRIAALSRVTIVNSDQHRHYVARFTDRIRQIPSVVDGERFRYVPREPDPDRPVRIGWSGSSSTAGNLATIASVLRRIARRDDVELRFIGANGLDLPGVPFSSRPWLAESEVDDLRELDIGLLPLPDTAWTRRKFYLKLVQYMALGIPAVCTPLGANPLVVEHGRTGFLADGDGEWTDALERLVEDAALRVEMGRLAAARAHERYTLKANTERIVEAFRYAHG
ncbi:MAG TPA: glycosyltransferase [Solirubrobacteraceae bacterium]|nr:glycosyltransferase [Solirubrobacteraceae bacterium]